MQEKLENTNIFKNSLTLKQSLKPAMVTKVPKVSSLPIDNWNVKVHMPLSENKRLFFTIMYLVFLVCRKISDIISDVDFFLLGKKMPIISYFSKDIYTPYFLI